MGEGRSKERQGGGEPTGLSGFLHNSPVSKGGEGRRVLFSAGV